MSDPATSLLDIGSQCAHPTCKEVDFLPISCQFCTLAYCRNHAAPDAHQCSVDPTANKPSDVQSSGKLQRCAVENCTKPSLHYSSDGQSADPTCPQCQQSFCASHQHPYSHSCPQYNNSEPPKSDKTQAARILLAKNFPSSSNSTKHPSGPPRAVNPKIPTDPAKLALFKKVELMKMRHRAVNGDPKDRSVVPLHNRVHLKMEVDHAEKVFYFRKSMIVGKVLDCLATHAAVKRSDTNPLQLLDLQGRALPNTKSIAEEIEDGMTVIISQSSS